MAISIRIRRRLRRLYSCTYSILFLAVICSLLSFTLSAAEEDDYLSEINMEGEKVGKRTSVSPYSGGDAPVAARRAGLGFTPGMSIDAFVVYLEETYAGSAVFYKKLELWSQEEIYEAYAGGASYAEVRKKIMDRFLKRR